ncbi:MAG: murein L,D-transpeptidase [Methylobacterium frigidaeris]
MLGAVGLLAVLRPDAAGAVPKHALPVPAATLARMGELGLAASAPILMRAYKKESEIEVWKRSPAGRYVLLKTFPVCRWSGQLGPKTRTGDRQTPEGFYPVAPRQMNPNSRYFLSFDVGYPNAFDRAHGGTGSAVMVHGTCSSAGCFAMTDRQVGEIYALARDAFAGGQAAFQFQSYPFRMTAQNLARHRTDRNLAFWRQLKEGSDRFEATGQEPAVTVAGDRYAFAPYPDPATEAAAVARIDEETSRYASLLAQGIEAVRTTYSDGGQHATFAALMRAGAALGEVSRPEALALAGQEIVLIPGRKRPVLLAAMVPVPVSLPVIETEPSLFARAPLAEGPTRLTLAAAPQPSKPLFSAATPVRFGPVLTAQLMTTAFTSH